MDDYADALGIELVPCIQTLGHLGQMLQWPKYHIYRDTNEVLLVNWDETYNLIEKVCLHSFHIHRHFFLFDLSIFMVVFGSRVLIRPFF